MNFVNNVEQIIYQLKYNRYFRIRKFLYKYREGKALKVNLILEEGGWILQKFAEKTNEELNKMGIAAKISNQFDHNCSINHYFAPDAERKVDDRTTFMITHVMKTSYLNWIKKITDQGAVGICMSRETMNNLIQLGVKRNKICYINPAQDGEIKPRKIKMGFTNRVYSDNRKREEIILDVCRDISPSLFMFEIMGDGWNDIINEMEEMGFEVIYHADFQYDIYIQMMQNLDYYCYFGFDEGSMGFLDAVAAGIGLMVSPQGFHLDLGVNIEYPVSTIQDIKDAFNDISLKRKKNFEFSQNATWENYAKKHRELWEYITGVKHLSQILSTRGWYQDGIYSMMLDELKEYIPFGEYVRKKKGAQIETRG